MMAVEKVMDHITPKIVEKVDERIDGKPHALHATMMQQMEARFAEQDKKLSACSSSAMSSALGSVVPQSASQGSINSGSRAKFDPSQLEFRGFATGWNQRFTQGLARGSRRVSCGLAWAKCRDNDQQGGHLPVERRRLHHCLHREGAGHSSLAPTGSG